MKTASLSSADSRPVDPTTFHGSVTRADLIDAGQPDDSAIVVRFDRGAHTHWHRHPRGQFLYIIEGEGLVQARGESAAKVRSGDCIYAPPGEEHWHGASGRSSVAHLAISLGATDWLVPVAAADYDEASG